MLFDVPIAYFFVPPPGSEHAQLADTGRPAVELYAAVLGHKRQLASLDERLAEMGVKKPDALGNQLLSKLLPKGYCEGVTTPRNPC